MSKLPDCQMCLVSPMTVSVLIEHALLIDRLVRWDKEPEDYYRTIIKDYAASGPGNKPRRKMAGILCAVNRVLHEHHDFTTTSYQQLFAAPTLSERVSIARKVFGMNPQSASLLCRLLNRHNPL